MLCVYSVLMNILLFVIQCAKHTLTDEFVEDENHSYTADINHSDETEPAAEVKLAEKVTLNMGVVTTILDLD